MVDKMCSNVRQFILIIFWFFFFWKKKINFDSPFDFNVNRTWGGCSLTNFSHARFVLDYLSQFVEFLVFTFALTFMSWVIISHFNVNIFAAIWLGEKKSNFIIYTCSPGTSSWYSLTANDELKVKKKRRQITKSDIADKCIPLIQLIGNYFE